ncbi:hypothetical protein EJ07DRAFT_186865 [Lizonia empirigonia]|nr:hypothetical protein EJ07DRAFT_186865 [Lizonia empirigonia]
MDPIQKAIEEIESRDPGASFSCSQVAKKYNVGRVTLARRHQGQTQPRRLAHLSLHPQHETELVQYIKTLTERRKPPKRQMIRDFANPTHLISRWQRGMDQDRQKADSETKYSLYFELLHDKMKEYNVERSHIFNMDEKGFMIGVLGRSKRVFDKKIYEQKGVTAAVQDGTRK